MKLPPHGATGHAIPEERAAPKRKRCKNCPRFFRPRPKGGTPQEFCCDNCRKEFHRNGAAFGALREKLPGYIAKEVQKQLGRPTEEQYRDLLVNVAAIQLDMAAIADRVKAQADRDATQFGVIARRIEKVEGDLNAHKQGL